MLVQFEVRDDVIRRNSAREHGLHDHLIRTAEARRLQAEAIANSVSWLWTNARRAFRHLANGTSRERTPATNGKQTLGRASVADALRRDLLRLARIVRHFILGPYARRRRRGIAIAQLRSLDDHLLADIGLTRGQIEQAVDGMLARRGEPLSQPVERSVPAEDARDELRMAA